MTRDEYVEKLTEWVVNNREYTDELIADVKGGKCLDGVYSGSSRATHRLVLLAYLRGVRRGASLAWDAQQKVVLRGEP